jgi:hypothetical protein
MIANSFYKGILTELEKRAAVLPQPNKKSWTEQHPLLTAGAGLTLAGLGGYAAYKGFGGKPATPNPNPKPVPNSRLTGATVPATLTTTVPTKSTPLTNYGKIEKATDYAQVAGYGTEFGADHLGGASKALQGMADARIPLTSAKPFSSLSDLADKAKVLGPLAKIAPYARFGGNLATSAGMLTHAFDPKNTDPTVSKAIEGGAGLAEGASSLYANTFAMSEARRAALTAATDFLPSSVRAGLSEGAVRASLDGWKRWAVGDAKWNRPRRI